MNGRLRAALMACAAWLAIHDITPVSAYSYGAGVCVGTPAAIIYPQNPNGMQNVVLYSQTATNNGAVNNGWVWVNANTNTGQANTALTYLPGQQQTYQLVNTIGLDFTGVLIYAYDTATGIRVGNFQTTSDMYTVPNCDGYINNTYVRGQTNPYGSVNTTLTHAFGITKSSGYGFTWTAPATTKEITFNVAIMNGARTLVIFQTSAAAVLPPTPAPTTLTAAPTVHITAQPTVAATTHHVVTASPTTTAAATQSATATCNAPLVACGGACYSPADYTCVDGNLVQVPVTSSSAAAATSAPVSVAISATHTPTATSGSGSAVSGQTTGVTVTPTAITTAPASVTISAPTSGKTASSGSQRTMSALALVGGVAVACLSAIL